MQDKKQAILAATEKLATDMQMELKNIAVGGISPHDFQAYYMTVATSIAVTALRTIAEHIDVPLLNITGQFYACVEEDINKEPSKNLGRFNIPKEESVKC